MLSLPEGACLKKITFQTAKFLGSMLKIEEEIKDRHGKLLPEVAIVGRSNVGKSSLINHLLRHKTLARVSSKPGKTITLNYFNIDDALILVDLPGYGYASRPQEEQLEWSESIDSYFEKRQSLKLILLLVDSRRELTHDDVQIIKWALHHRKNILLIFTKSDTLKPQEKAQVSERIASFHPTVPSIYYSIKEGKSRDVLISKINQLLAE
jgi:GTP-binding protein